MMTQIEVETLEKPENSNVFYFDKTDDFQCEGYTKGGWYFWNETETSLVGPFTSAKKAQIALDVYVGNLDRVYNGRRYYHDGDGIIREVE